MTQLGLDAELCQGHGRCYSLAPGLFDSDDEGFAVVLEPGAAGWAPDDLQRVVNSCPEGAITLGS